MARGRRAQSDVVRALKGNPGKRRLALDTLGKGPALAKPAALVMPEFLTHERERALFRSVIEDYLQRRVARPPDLTAYARWATYLHKWLECKEAMDTGSGDARVPTFIKLVSKHGERYTRNPIFKDLLDLEHVLQTLEDRLGLNPVARQSIMRGLSAMPAALGGLFGEEKPEDDKVAEGVPDGPAPDGPEAPISPLGYLQSAGSKPH